MYSDIVGRDMSDTERQEETLSQRVVKEAVDRGMESPLRETIIEAVNESEDEEESVPKVPFGAAMLGIGGALGYLLGIRNVQQSERESYSMAPSNTSEAVDEAETDAESDAEAETDAEPDASGGSWFKRIALLAGIGAAVVLIRSKLRSSDQEEWEPIEEFETTVPTSDEPEIIGDEDEGESEGEAIEIDTGEEEAEADSEDLDDDEHDETDLEAEETEE